MQTGVNTITIQGIDVPVVRQGTGRPLLLLHGGDGPQGLLPLVTRLAERFEVIAPTHPGFAGTAIPEHFDALADLVYLYLDLLDALDLHDVILMGMSMGGWVAVEVAVRNTSRLSQLILVDAVGIKPGDRDTRDIADIFGLPAPEAAKLLYHDPAQAPGLSTMTDEQVTQLAGDRIAHAMYTWEPYMHNPKLKHRLGRVKAKTLFIWGENDGIVTPQYGRTFAHHVPGASFVSIGEAGHYPHIEQPGEFMQCLRAFLD